MPRGAVIVVTGPSASGKTTVAERLMAEMPNVARMITTTTRTPRPGEFDGRDYHFTTTELFDDQRVAGDFIEWAENYGNFYGSSRAVLEGLRDKYDAVIAVLDLKGALAYREVVPGCVTVFIAPSSVDELSGRFAKRPGSTPESTARRLADAESELAKAPLFDFTVVNADGGLDQAVLELKSIVQSAISRP